MSTSLSIPPTLSSPPGTNQRAPGERAPLAAHERPRRPPLNLRQTPGFVRRVRKLTPRQRDAVARALRRFTADPFDPALRTHKLSGDLEGRWAFSAAYNLRVICRIEDDVAYLLAVGTHDEVY